MAIMSIFGALGSVMNTIGGMKKKTLDSLNGAMGSVSEAAMGASGLSQLFDITAMLKPVFDLLKPIATLIQTFSSILSAKLAPAMEAMFNAFLSEDMLAAVESLATTIADALVPVILMLVDAFVQAVESGAFDTLISIVSSLIDVMITAGEALMPIVELIMDSIGPILELLADALQMIFEAVGPLISQLADAFMPVIEILIEGIKGLLDILGPVISQIIDAMAPALEAFADILGQIFMALQPVLESLVMALVPVFQTLSEVLVEVFAAIEPLIPVVVELVQSLVDALAPSLEIIIKVFGGILEAAIPMIITMTESLIPIFEAFAEVLEILVETGFLDAIIDGMVQLGQAFAEFMALFQPVFEFMGTFITGIARGFEQDAASIINAWNSFIDTMEAGFSAFVNFFIGIINGVIDIWNTLDFGNVASVENIEYLQGGGTIMESGPAVVHKGEMVMNTDMMRAFMEGIATIMDRGNGMAPAGNGGAGTTINMNVNGFSADGVRELTRRQRELTFMGGR